MGDHYLLERAQETLAAVSLKPIGGDDPFEAIVCRLQWQGIAHEARKKNARAFLKLALSRVLALR
jgi:hypothetical protein